MPAGMRASPPGKAALLQRVGDVGRGGSAGRHFAAGGGDHDVLPAGEFVSCGGALAGGGDHRLPEEFARILVERADLAVLEGGGDEDQPAGGDDGASVVLAPRVTAGGLVFI